MSQKGGRACHGAVVGKRLVVSLRPFTELHKRPRCWDNLPVRTRPRVRRLEFRCGDPRDQVCDAGTQGAAVQTHTRPPVRSEALHRAFGCVDEGLVCTLTPNSRHPGRLRVLHPREQPWGQELTHRRDVGLRQKQRPRGEGAVGGAPDAEAENGSSCKAARPPGVEAEACSDSFCCEMRVTGRRFVCGRLCTRPRHSHFWVWMAAVPPRTVSGPPPQGPLSLPWVPGPRLGAPWVPASQSWGEAP